MALEPARTWNIENLRRAVVAVAVVLLLAILGFVIYARWRLRHIAQDLPAHLGITIQQTTQGYVLSKTEQGRTVFTLHAARAVEFKSGKRVSLHNVEIDMYNRQGGAADTISGKDFEFDPHTQVVQSQGETHILLHAPGSATGTGLARKTGGQPIRIATHGLVFSQKTGVATCSGEVDFQVAGSSGQAVGAEYDSKQGHLLLQSQVVLRTVMQNRPAVLHAYQAMYDRDANQAHLLEPRYSSALPHGTERAQAQRATVYLRKDGSAERLNAQGDVRLSSGDGTTVRSAAMNAMLGKKSQPQQMHFSGGVQFNQNQPTGRTAGSSQDAEVDFNAQGRAELAVFDRAVQFYQQMDDTQNHLQRTLTADHLVLHLLPAKTGQAQLQSAEATGNAIFTSRSTTPGHPPQKTTLAAQTLKAQFLAGNQLQHIDGAGQTRIRTVAANGDIDTSSGDTLKVDFSTRPSAKLGKNIAPSVSSIPASAAGSGNAGPAQSIQRAVQTGHVVMEQAARPKNGATSGPAISMAHASRAAYVAANDTLTLTGAPVFHNEQLEMTAGRIEVERATGNVVLTGAVQSTLRPTGRSRTGTSGLLGGSGPPVHIIAQRALLRRQTQEAIFTGRARLWQGGDSVEAPVIELSQTMQTLTAYSTRPCAQCVIGNFLGQPTTSAPTATRRLPQNSQPSTFRVLSDKLLYSDAERKASFLNHVQVIGADGQLFADHAEMFLTPAAHPALQMGADRAENQNNPSPRNNSTPSSVERIVATGQVRLMQPGRRATGARLVYTAKDGHFVLTGDAENPPEVFDADHETVTGQVLTFSSPEQAIIVSGSSSRATTTRTRVKKK